MHDAEMKRIFARMSGENEPFHPQRRIERALVMASVVDQVAAAACTGWGQPWISRRVNPDAMARHKNYNVAWTRQKRARIRVEKQQALVEAVAATLVPTLAAAIQGAVETAIVNALNDSESGNQSVAYSLTCIADALRAQSM